MPFAVRIRENSHSIDESEAFEQARCATEAEAVPGSKPAVPPMVMKGPILAIWL